MSGLKNLLTNAGKAAVLWICHRIIYRIRLVDFRQQIVLIIPIVHPVAFDFMH